MAALLLVGCSGGNGKDSDSGRSEAEILSRLADGDRGPKRSIVSKDGSLTAVVPERWGQVPDVYPGALLTLASGSDVGTVINPCQPGAVLDEIPTGGALVRISEALIPAKPSVGGIYPRRPRHFRLGRENPAECGSVHELRFRASGRNLAASIWVSARTRGRPGELGSSPRGISPRVRRETMEMLDGLRVRSAAEMPIRNPILALDCRNPPNTLRCDRVWVHLSTRTGMAQVSVRINRWSARSPEGWVHGARVISLPTRLRTSSPSDLPIPTSAKVPSNLPLPKSVAVPRTVWEASISRAGLGTSGEDFEQTLPGPGGKWVGNNPGIRADLEVISPRGRWNFRRVRLIAGHG